MLPPETVRVELGPGGVQLIQLFLDEGAILRGAAVLQLLALRLDLGNLGLDGGEGALQLLKFTKKWSMEGAYTVLFLRHFVVKCLTKTIQM